MFIRRRFSPPSSCTIEDGAAVPGGGGVASPTAATEGQPQAAGAGPPPAPQPSVEQPPAAGVTEVDPSVIKIDPDKWIDPDKVEPPAKPVGEPAPPEAQADPGKRLEQVEARMKAAETAMRSEVLERLGVKDKFRAYAPAADPFTQQGKSALEKWAQANPELCHSAIQGPPPAPTAAELERDLGPGARLISPDEYARGLRDIERRFGRHT